MKIAIALAISCAVLAFVKAEETPTVTLEAIEIPADILDDSANTNSDAKGEPDKMQRRGGGHDEAPPPPPPPPPPMGWGWGPPPPPMMGWGHPPAAPPMIVIPIGSGLGRARSIGLMGMHGMPGLAALGGGPNLASPFLPMNMGR